MKENIRYILLSFCFLVLMPYAMIADVTPQQKYIDRYCALAVEEMYRSGVPASITLAQGLLESRYGQSELAVKGNNHFGIKCHNNWRGGKVYHDDDHKGECFRKYDSPEESFRDHSDFLRYRDRYKFLFDLEITDYKGWAYGLKKAGYATDPSYPAKLIRLIDEYSLYEYDRLPAGYMKHKPTKSESKKKRVEKEPVQSVVPEPPSRIEAVKVLDKSAAGEFIFSLSRQMYSLNGVPFVYSSEGETYASIAKAFNLFPKEILRINDLSPTVDMDTELMPGTVLYVQPKKNEAAKGLEKHVIEKGDTLRGISQRYGVKLKKLMMMNGLTGDDVLKEGDIIKLRK